MDDKNKTEKDYADISRIYIFLWILIIFMPKMLSKKLVGEALLNTHFVFTLAALICVVGFAVCFFKKLKKSKKAKMYAAFWLAIALCECIHLSVNFNYIYDRLAGSRQCTTNDYVLTAYENGGGGILFDDDGESEYLILSQRDFDAVFKKGGTDEKTAADEEGAAVHYQSNATVSIEYYPKSRIVKSIALEK